MEKFYKLARVDGWDFFTGRTINYHHSIGKEVKVPNFDAEGELCSDAFLYASRTPNQCFAGAKIPCSAYLVSGRPVIEDDEKCGFKTLFVEKELEPESIFEWNYREAVNPIHPFKVAPPEISHEIISLLYNWANMWAKAGDSVMLSVGNNFGNNVWAAVWSRVWAAVWVSVLGRMWDRWDSVRFSVMACVLAYAGSLFIDCIKKWEYIDHKPGEYPFQSAAELWRKGLVASFDGKLWRLHGGNEGKVLWEGDEGKTWKNIE